MMVNTHTRSAGGHVRGTGVQSADVMVNTHPQSAGGHVGGTGEQSAEVRVNTHTFSLQALGGSWGLDDHAWLCTVS